MNPSPDRPAKTSPTSSSPSVSDRKSGGDMPDQLPVKLLNVQETIDSEQADALAQHSLEYQALEHPTSEEQASEEQVPEEQVPEEQVPEEQTQAEHSPVVAKASSDAEETPEENSDEEPSSDSGARTWQHPIPPPSEPRQYRAIGLVRGRYTASEEQFTQGILLTNEGTIIDAVLLGRVMSLVKKHIDLEQEHLWVVYPRTRQNEGNLHVQIVGVWEPETLKKIADQPEEGELGEKAAEELGIVEAADDGVDDSFEEELASEISEIEHGYFSIRGEAVYQSQEEDRYVIVKIRQAARKEGEKPKFFKLKLQGLAGPKAVGHFWDLHVQLSKDMLLIQESHDIGMLPLKRRGRPPFRGGGGGGGRPPFKPSFSRSFDAPQSTGEKPKPVTAAPRREPISRPTKAPPKDPEPQS
ncbi:MAG: hypothetical protein ACRC8A_01915 [Microcoleaceae cyanobacterium]